MNKRSVVLATVALVMGMALPMAMAQPAADPATCSITVVVNDIMEWNSNFAAIDLGTITARTDTPTGNAAISFYTNGDATIAADNTTTAELSEAGGDTLYTEYRLTYDGDGLSETGGSTVDWTVYSSFLSTPPTVTHIAGDGVVQVTLEARASIPTGTLADSGNYSATQTLTASWSG